MKTNAAESYETQSRRMAVRVMLDELVADDDLRAVLEKLVKRARAGHVPAADLLLRLLIPPA